MASIEVEDDLTVTGDNGRTSECAPLYSVGTRMIIRSAGSLGCNYCPEKRPLKIAWTEGGRAAQKIYSEIQINDNHEQNRYQV